MTANARPAPMAHPHVSFLGVSKVYDGGVRAVGGLDLDIAQGEFLTLLGPSGSGKTTSLMMLAGFESPSNGQITLAGRDITKIPAHRRGIGMVFQNYALFPHMTVAENLAFPLSVRGMARADRDRLVSRVLARVKLDGLQDRRPAQLSGGQQQRVALARALVFEPALVLMDEPLGALDKQLRESLQYEIKEMHTSFGVTIVYVTHDQGEALTMSDRIALFNSGRIEQLGDPRTIYDSPATTFAARFIGETNILPGTVCDRGAGGMVRVDLGGGTVVTARQGNISGHRGEATTFCLRPQHLRITADTAETTNCFQGRTVDVIFHGDHLRLQLVLPSGARLIARLPADGNTNFAEGSEVTLTFDLKNGFALDAVQPMPGGWDG